MTCVLRPADNGAQPTAASAGVADDTAALVEAAAGGDRIAWESLVDRYVGLIWAIAGRFRLSPADASDVTQTTWLRLLENIDRLTEPGRLGAWLATTARRECLKVLAQARRAVPVPEEGFLDIADVFAPGPEVLVIAEETAVAIGTGFDRLPERCRRLLELLLTDPPPSYQQASDTLGLPIGSLGPTRGRCLEKLRAILGPRYLADLS